MNKSIGFFLLLFSVLPGMAFSQNALLARMEKGVEAHRRYNLVTCDTVLSAVLEKKELLSRAQLGEASYFYNRNLIRLAIEEGQSKNGFATMPVQIRLYKAYFNLLELERENIPRWSVKADPEIKGMFETMLKASVNCMEVYVESGEAYNAQLNTLIESYTNLAIRIAPESYIPFELKGQMYYYEGDTTKAVEYFDMAIKKYRVKRVLLADNIRMPNVYYTRALEYMNTSSEKAYKLARQGYKVNELEWKTIQTNKAKLGENVIVENKAIYFNNQYNLGWLELELIITMGNKDSALLLYKEREDYYRDKYYFQVNYANLLRDVNPRDASMHYQAAIDIMPNYHEAYFAMASLYFDMGYYYLNEAKTDKANAKENTERGLQLLEVGYPYMQQAHKYLPESNLALKTLLKVSKELDKKTDYNYYKKTLNEFNKP